MLLLPFFGRQLFFFGRERKPPTPGPPSAQVARLCADFEIDVSCDLIPVRPSAHYMIGGVEVELDGSSSVDGLLCCGEAASTPTTTLAPEFSGAFVIDCKGSLK